MRGVLAVMGGSLALAGAVGAATIAPHVQPVMKDIVAPQAQVMWDVGNKAYDDDGNVDLKRISAADWAVLAKASEAMKEAALALAEAPKVSVGPTGVKLQDEEAPGATTARQVQGFIDADPKGFADQSRDLAAVSERFLEAVKTRDAETLADASARLDAVCEACHIRYWYPPS